ncbi:DNA topoisomerase IV [Christiangramia salexigens]|uniref:DNA topoisomerase IV n=1 Tax=Christiangramia salexigens TaxID=1913577 RepID=A0A1L3J3D1_9FLAO|nr:DNA topoisomerase IV [Christiangramia salexigens]APG59641.1 DNA topoisomerase IV [Christiangramia salexigens]
MKKILLLLGILMMVSCFNAERNCEDYRTGTFEFQTYLNGELATSRFIRNDSIEIEKFQGETDTSSVRWINDCEYILRNINPDGMSEEKPVHIKILTTNSNGYTFEYGRVGDPKKARGSVTRVD